MRISAAHADSLDQTSNGAAPVLAEVVVSAEKQPERLQDVPVPVTVLEASQLLQQNQVRLQDYFASIPGVDFTTDARGTPQIGMRGLSTGTQVGNPTVGVTIDDVPFGSSSTYGGLGAPVPDLDPFDLSRVEVLRGPQGTLYGADSIGGLIKFVTADPSTEAFSGRAEATTNSVYNGENLGYGFRVGLNVPITSTLALRASGFTRQDPGYVDDVATHKNGVNVVDASGGYLGALWRPSGSLSIKLTAILQTTSGYGSPWVDPELGDLKQSELVGAGGYHQNLQGYIATVSAMVGGGIRLTSVSGYTVSVLSDAQDISGIFGPLLDYGSPPQFPGFGHSGASQTESVRTAKYSEELRLSGTVWSRLDWLVGGFFTYEHSHVSQFWWGINPATGAQVGNFYSGHWPTMFTEHAGFADLTLHVTHKFDLELGGRETQNRQTYTETDSGYYGLLFEKGNPTVVPETDTSDNSFTYLFTPKYKFYEGLMAYARLASGYRPGGPNPTCSAFDVPCHFGPDTTENYELGVKAEPLGGALGIDASVYYIDWKNIQLPYIPACGCATIYENGSGAKSEGVELSVQARPLTGMNILVTGSYDNAVLTAPLPQALYGVAGDRLPYTSKLAGNLSIEQQFPMTSQITADAGGSLTYVGNRLAIFQAYSIPQIPRYYMPAYAQINLQTGVFLGQWKTSLYLNNVADRRGALDASMSYALANVVQYQYIQPRTLGLSISTTF